jgi:hypothetical protein
MRRLGSRKVYQKKKKKVGVVKKNGDDVTAQKLMTSFKQVARHMMEFLKIKSTCPSDFPKNVTLILFQTLCSHCIAGILKM